MKRDLLLQIKIIQICVVFIAIQNACAQQVSSAFNVDAEGWTVINNDGEGNFGRGKGPEYHATGGNPGGHIQIIDNIPGSYTAVAPPKFNGNMMAYKNGIIGFEALAVSGEVSASTERAEFGLITITSPYGVAQLDIAPTIPNFSTYTLYSVNLTDSVWHKTSAEWDLILSNVTSITILLEYSKAIIGDDRIAVDNFIVGQPDLALPPCNGGDHKVYVCHRASGNNEKEHTICIDEHAVDNHMKHYDYLGPCSTSTRKNGNAEAIIEEVSSFDLEEDGILVFPNPFNNSLTIDMGNIDESDYGKIEIKMYDFIGRNVMEISGIENSEKVIDMSMLGEGIYTYCILKDKIRLQSGKLKKGL